MVTCQYKTKMWMEPQVYLRQNYGFKEDHINLAAPNIILNKVLNRKKYAVNFLKLLAKQYSYNQQFLKRSVSSK